MSELEEQLEQLRTQLQENERELDDKERELVESKDRITALENQMVEYASLMKDQSKVCSIHYICMYTSHHGKITYAMPLNRGHFGTGYFISCREVVLDLEVKRFKCTIPQY